MLEQELIRIGGTPITLWSLIAPILVITATLMIAGFVGTLFARLHRNASPSRATLVYVSGQMLRYAVLFGGFFLAVSTAGLNLTSLSIFAGALGVGIGLGLQDIVKNFVYGLLLLFERSVEVGDFVELDDGTRGQVVAIGPRATTINTNDNVDVLVPNAMLLSGALTNWTRNRGTRRVHVPFSVAYGSDKEKVKAAALEAAKSVPFTIEGEGRQRTQVWLTEFGDSALEFELVVWPTLEAVKRPGSMFAAYRWALDDALRRHGLEIPFPQRDVRVRALFGHEGEDAFAALKDRGSPPPAPTTAEPDLSRNDAAEDIPPESADEGQRAG
jgi:small-conductance mechanosensitive channel